MGSSRSECCRHRAAVVLIVMCIIGHAFELEASPLTFPHISARLFEHHLRGLKFLVEETTVLTYHNGTILTGSGAPPSLSVYLIWYGNFTDAQKAIVMDFFASTQSYSASPSVANWWKLMGGYKDMTGGCVPSELKVVGEISNVGCSMGKHLGQADLEALVTDSLAAFPADAGSIYVVLTAEDVEAVDFCNSECASHYTLSASPASQTKELPFAWVGNPGSQCPGKCSWPFAQPSYGPYNIPLLPPNGDVGMDGMIINLGTILAGMAANPFNTGYFQGDASAPNEAATGCVGMFGPGSYPGYAGQLLSDSSTGRSFNAYGVNGRTYLVPGLWDPKTLNCTTPS